MILDQFFHSRGWQVVAQSSIPEREGKNVHVRELDLSEKTKQTLSKIFPNGIYHHQKVAIDSVINCDHVCLATGTASGKSLVFYVAALEHLAKRPKSKILAIYPLKALAKEQEDRWRDFFTNAGISVGVGRIDGQVPIHSRLPLLKNSQLLIATPDVIHAWFMMSLNDKVVANFLREIKLIIVDEAHTYTGVFGSNAAYLFRRIRHIMSIMDSNPQYIAASATIGEPSKHLENLFGLNFTIIDSKNSGSKLAYEVDTLLKKNSISVYDIDTFGIDTGPGSFTGIRIGISFLSGLLATKKNLEVKNIISTDIINESNTSPISNFAVLRRAREDTAYVCIYKDKTLVDQPHMIKGSELAYVLNGLELTGEESKYFIDKFSLDNIFFETAVTPQGMRNAFMNSKTLKIEDLKPLYLQKPLAVEIWEEKNKTSMKKEFWN